MKNVYIHDIPGRLRVRGQAIKNDQVAAGVVRGLLAETPGVVSATTNLLTGSILVTYEVRSGLTSAEILTMLRQCGILDAETSGPERRSMSQALLRKVGQMALDWTFKRALSVAVSVLL